MPEEAHAIMQALRSQRDEELLDLVRDTLAQLNKLGDRLESHLRDADTEEVGSNVPDESRG